MLGEGGEDNKKRKKRKKRKRKREKSTLLVLTEGSFEMTPVPLQGESRSTLSKPPSALGNSLPSRFVTTTFFTPKRWRFPTIALQRALLGSLANTLPVFFIRAEM